MLTATARAQSEALTDAFKAQQNASAAKIAALVALYYQSRVAVEDPSSVERWLNLMIPRIISGSDAGARSAVRFFDDLRRIEAAQAKAFRATASLGTIDEGVAKSLKAVGPFDYMNKASAIERLDISPTAKKALLVEAKQTTSTAIAAATIRHVQAGSRQTIHDNAAADRVALGWVRVTKAKPCAFCVMLASRGVHYRAFSEQSFVDSNARFSGEGDAKVHDNCGCTLKPVFELEGDPIIERNQQWVDLWERWGAGGGDATRRFRRAYDHWLKTGEFMDWDVANEGLRAA